MLQRKSILASAGTATGLLAADMHLEDLLVHPRFTEALAANRSMLVKSLTVEELKLHPAFHNTLKAAVEAAIQAQLKELKDEQLESLPAIKAFIDKKVQAAVVNAETAKAFVAMLNDVQSASLGQATGADTRASAKPQPSYPDNSSEDGNRLETATRALMASEGKLSYGEALIVAAKQIGYRQTS